MSDRLQTALPSVSGASGREIAVVGDVERALEVAGDDVGAIRALEELAEAAKRYASTHEQRVEASVAKLKIARHGGYVLIEMAKRGQRKVPATARTSNAPGLDDLGLTKMRSSRWQAIANLSDAEYDRREEALREMDPDAELGKDPHIVANSGEAEWFTPADYIEAARRVMGGIDLDPASTPVANDVIKAGTFYTVAQDGLRQEWFGRVWMNPPFSGALVRAFCERLSEDFSEDRIEQACVLVNNATETGWFQRMAELAAAICFPSGRIPFWHPDREGTTPLQGQAVLYFGPNLDAFRADFMAFGFTVAL